MSLNTIVMYLIATFIFASCLDKILGGKLGLGKYIDTGFYTLGPLSMIMIGMITLSPVLARVINPLIAPVLQLIGADPSLFVGAVFANDSGGASLAMDICVSRDAGLLNGCIVASMLGASLGVIPIVLSATNREKHRFVILGMLIGFTTVPASALLSSVLAGLDMSVVLYNLAPVTIFSVIIIFALIYVQSYAVKVTVFIGKIILWFSAVGFFASAFELLTGYSIIKGMAPIEDAFVILGNIGVVLAGMFPVIHLADRFVIPRLSRLTSSAGLDEPALLGIVTTVVNFFPVIPMLNKMPEKGIVINMAFVVPAGYAIGDHLGFTAAFENTLVFPLIAGKLFGGILAIIIAVNFCKYARLNEAQEQ